MGAGSGFGNGGGSGGGGGIDPNAPFLNPAISYTNTPPGAPAVGDRYLTNTAPTGAWVGRANQVAEWDGGSWIYTVPATGDYIFITDTLLTYRFTGTSWVVSPGIAILQNGNAFGTPMVIGTNDNNYVSLKHNNSEILRLNRASTATSTFYFSPTVYVDTDLDAMGLMTMNFVGAASRLSLHYVGGFPGLAMVEGNTGKFLSFAAAGSSTGAEIYTSAPYMSYLCATGIYGFGTGAGGKVQFNTNTGLAFQFNSKVENTLPTTLMGYTVALLPTGVIGDLAYVTDALAPAYNTPLVGGGAVKIKAFYNGAAWIAA